MELIEKGSGNEMPKGCDSPANWDAREYRGSSLRYLEKNHPWDQDLAFLKFY